MLLSGVALKVVVAAALSSVAIGGAVAVAVDAPVDTAQVVRVVDGDTVDVRLHDGSPQRVRLLNVDTPETKDPDEAVQCLGPEAAEFLAAALPPGESVRLSYDTVRYDGFGRLLAGVTTDDGTLLNAEVARRGLGIAVMYEPNRRHYYAVRAAQEEARRSGQGLYASTVSCTLVAKVVAVEAEVSEAQSTAAGTLPAMDTAAARSANAAAAASDLRRTFDEPRQGLTWSAFNWSEQQVMAKRVETARESARRVQATWRKKASATRARDAEPEQSTARPRTPAADAGRGSAGASEQPAPEHSRVEAVPQKPRTPDVPRTPSGSAGRGPHPGYNGPRCYEPGGRVWHPC